MGQLGLFHPYNQWSYGPLQTHWSPPGGHYMFRLQGSGTQPFATLTGWGGDPKYVGIPHFWYPFFGSYLQDHVFVTITTISFLSHLRVSLVYLHGYFLLGKYNMPTPLDLVYITTPNIVSINPSKNAAFPPHLVPRTGNDDLFPCIP